MGSLSAVKHCVTCSPICQTPTFLTLTTGHVTDLVQRLDESPGSLGSRRAADGSGASSHGHGDAFVEVEEDEGDERAAESAVAECQQSRCQVWPGDGASCRDVMENSFFSGTGFCFKFPFKLPTLRYLLIY